MIDRDTRRHLIILVCVLILWAVIALWWSGQAGAQGGPIVDKHLLVDGALVDTSLSSNYVFVVNPPTVLSRVETFDDPWSNFGAYHFPPVVRDWNGAGLEGARYSLTYPAWYRPSGSATGGQIANALLVSNDGANWRKPTNVDDTLFEGNPSNLLSTISLGNSSFDPLAPAAERFKRADPLPDGWFGFTQHSADGTYWQNYDPPIRLMEKPYGVDGDRTFYFDERTGRYLFFLRGWNDYKVGSTTRWARAVNLSDSTNVTELQWTDIAEPHVQWPNVGSTLPPQYAISDEVPLLFFSDAADWTGWDGGRQQGVQIYRSSPEKYGDIYVAFPWMYHLLSTTTTPKGSGSNDGGYDTEFAVSRDGRSWTRYRTPKYFESVLSCAPVQICTDGKTGVYDGTAMWMALSGQGIIVTGDAIYQPLLVKSNTKDGALLDGTWGRFSDGGTRQEAWYKADRGGIYITKQRLDGFVALQPKSSGRATVVTLPMTPAGPQLRVNHAGAVTVSVLDGDAVLASNRLTGDNLRSLAATNLPSKSLRLQFEIEPGTKVYAFEFVNPTWTPTPTPTRWHISTRTPTPKSTITIPTRTATWTQSPPIATASTTPPPTIAASPSVTPTRTPTKPPTPTAIPMTPTAPANTLLDNAVFRFESSAIAVPDGYRIDVTQADSSACWHYDIPGTLAGQRVTFGGELYRSADMGGYAPYLSLQALRSQAWAYNIGGTSRHTAAPGTWQTVSQTVTIPADARQVRASFCVWRAGPGTARARDMQITVLP